MNYNQLLTKYGRPLLIRENGSYMNSGGNQEITDTFVSEHLSWPVDKSANVVICENDLNPEDWWISYLTDRFPDERIQTLNCFSQRTMEDLKDNLEFPKIITFTTTFSQLQWFENLIGTVQYQSGKTLIVHWKGTDEVWEDIRLEFKDQIENFELSNKIEIVKI